MLVGILPKTCAFKSRFLRVSQAGRFFSQLLAELILCHLVYFASSKYT